MKAEGIGILSGWDNDAMLFNTVLFRGLKSALLIFVLCWASFSVQAADALPWFEGGRASPQALQAVALLEDAASHGLEPADYGMPQLAAAMGGTVRGQPVDEAGAARLERSLTAAMERYLSDLRDGRIDPRTIHHDFNVARRKPFDAAAVLRDAVAARRLAEAVREAAPQIPMYERLREALKQYRGLADHVAWKTPLPPLPLPSKAKVRKLEPGLPWNGLDLLAQRLVLLGDLPLLPPEPLLYEGALVDAVKAFQRRHGLAVDGAIGKATLAQLEIPPGERVQQIGLALERLRWTPFDQGPRMIVINLPEFVLRAYEVRDGRIQVQSEMKVIVGSAMDTRTPLFDEDMRFIEFSPYWNVPPSIARSETVPRLRRDPGYLDREGFEFVAPGGAVYTESTPARLAAVLGGQMRIRQRPGPRNALGDIKFVFPNQMNIFLHHTPSTSLFGRERRDFSHGCLRVEQPVELAKFVLKNAPEWSEARIAEAMAAGKSSTVRLAEPLPVLIAYGTSLVKNGRIHFFEDIYGLDRQLSAALRRGRGLAPLLEKAA